MNEAKSRRPLVIWAIDPFEKESEPATEAVKDFLRWVKDQGADLQPVYLASPASADTSLGLVVPVPELEDKLDHTVACLGAGASARAGRVLVETASSRQSAVKRLEEFAKKQGAVAIALSSHGRQGLERFAMGSFAESLLRETSMPVFFLARHPAHPQKGASQPTVLFATDFSVSSRAAFTRFLPIARRANAKVVLYHAVMVPIGYVPGDAVYIPENYYEANEGDAREAAAGWIEEGRRLKVPVEVLVKDGGAGFVHGDNVLEVARGLGAALIALSSVSGPLDRAMFGSAAYDVFRASTCPVFVYGPQALRSPAVNRKMGAEKRKSI